MYDAMLQLARGSTPPGAAANPRALVQDRYALNAAEALRLAFKRQWTLFLRNKAFLVFRLTQVS